MQPLWGDMPYSSESRREAGRILASLLTGWTRSPALAVLASGDGGAVIAFEVARQLEVPLEILSRAVRPIARPARSVRTAIVVDDALGGLPAVRGIVSAVRAMQPKHLVLAVPYVARELRDRLLADVDTFVWAILTDSAATVRALYDDTEARVIPEPPASHIRLTRRADM